MPSDREPGLATELGVMDDAARRLLCSIPGGGISWSFSLRVSVRAYFADLIDHYRQCSGGVFRTNNPQH